MRDTFTFRSLLPETLADALELIQEPLPTDPLSAVGTLLCGYSGLLKLGWVCASDHRYEVPINLFWGNVAISGLAKTPTKRALIDAPAAEVRLLHKRNYELAVERYDQEFAGTPTKDRPPKPRPRFPHITNYSPESMDIQLMLHERDGLGLLVLRDELSGLLQGLEQDSKRGGGNGQAQLLELFGAEPSTTTRVESFRSYERTHVSLFGNIQPEILQGLIDKRDPTGKWARFLWNQLPVRPLKLSYEDPTPQELADYNRAKQVLSDFALKLHGLAPARVELSQPARKLLIEWFDVHQNTALQRSTPPVVTSMLNKCSAHALRLAGILHLVHNLEADPLPPVDAGRMQLAMDIVDCLTTEMRFFYEDADDLQTDMVKRVHAASWRDGEPRVVTYQDCRNTKGVLTKPAMRSAGLFLAAIQQLEEMGFGEIIPDASPASFKATRALRL